MLISRINCFQVNRTNAYIKLFLSNQSLLGLNSCPKSTVNKVTKTSSYSFNKFSTTSPLLLGLNTRKTGSNDVRNNAFKLLGLFVSGVLAYSFYSTFHTTHHKDKNEKNEDHSSAMDEKFTIDLNEIYEKCAVRFLSNPKLQNALGLPIKITSHEADDIRQLYLRRHGKNLYAFVSYKLVGSHNTGHVYAKLIMDGETKVFSTVDIVLKLDKPFDGQKEIIIKSEKNKEDSNK